MDKKRNKAEDAATAQATKKGKPNISAEEKQASERINRLLAGASRSINQAYATDPFKFSFDPDGDSLTAVKQKHGSPRLLEALLQFQCQGWEHDGSSDDEEEEDNDDSSGSSSCRDRLGIIFMPNGVCAKTDDESDDDNSDDDDSNEDVAGGELDYRSEFGGVTPECVKCYEDHADAGDACHKHNCWTANTAAMFFDNPGLLQVMSGTPDGVCYSHLSALPFGKGKGNAPLFAANQISWGLQITVGDIWDVYWPLIQKHEFLKEEED